MNAGEFLALLDDRLSDGKRYPTIDDYTRALDEIHARERAEADAAAWATPQEQARELGRQAYQRNQLDMQNAAQRVGPPPETRELWWRLEVLGGDGVWYPVSATHSQSDDYLRACILPQHQRAQPHAKFRIEAYRK